MINLRIKLYCFLFCLTGSIGYSQTSMYAYNLSDSYIKPDKVYINIPKIQADCSNTKIWINWMALSTSALSTIAGTVYLIKAKKSYERYNNYKNDILYLNTLNSFNQSELQKYEVERNNLYNNAISEQKNGQLLLYGGGIGILTFHYTINKIKKRCPFRLRSWK
jgi:hypothetical protein